MPKEYDFHNTRKSERARIYRHSQKLEFTRKPIRQDKFGVVIGWLIIFLMFVYGVYSVLAANGGF